MSTQSLPFLSADDMNIVTISNRGTDTIFCRIAKQRLANPEFISKKYINEAIKYDILHKLLERF